MRPIGRVTRGTTNANRLRRVDNWICSVPGPGLPVAPLVVDLGFGATPVTTVELYRRLSAVRPAARVVGLEIDRVRAAEAQPYARPPGLTFDVGGFELAGLRPDLVRAMNVLRQYSEPDAERAWSTMRAALGPGGLLVDGTCDEVGRLAGWILLDPRGPRSLTLAARLSTLDTPAEFAERLPKALIHHNVPGEPVHDFLRAFDAAWAACASMSAFGPRQRWTAAVETMAEQGWPFIGSSRRWRHGEVTVRWSAVAPVPAP